MRRLADRVQLPRIGAARLILAVGFVMVVLAVSLQAQRVRGQQTLEELIDSNAHAATVGTQLRARVAAAESPANVLAAAEEAGMVQPAAVVAVPAAVGVAPPAAPAPPPDPAGRR